MDGLAEVGCAMIWWILLWMCYDMVVGCCICASSWLDSKEWFSEPMTRLNSAIMRPTWAMGLTN